MFFTRRQFLRTVGAASAVHAMPFARFRKAFAETLAPMLSDPAAQPKFVNAVPNALNPAFIYSPDKSGTYRIRMAETLQETGLIDPRSGRRLKTPVWGYGDDAFVSWPGRTFQVRSAKAGGPSQTPVRWSNELTGKKHLLPVDTSVHWCYSLHGMSSANGMDYRQYTIAKDGVPLITHLHGGHTDYQFDGNPEYFFSPDGRVVGPQWDFVPGGFTNNFRYDNNVPAGSLWYHDHALGMTRLNVYAGLAGFYFVRDYQDTGGPDNPLGLPAFPYEMALAVQDRMFTARGELFYPAFPGDPFYDDFITGEGVFLPPGEFPRGGPTALAEFFGDHMLVNGMIWPKADVEPRHYRLRLLNGTDSRFLIAQFAAVNAGVTDPNGGTPIPFWVVGSDQGLGTPSQTDTLVIEPGGRYDVVVDFSQVPFGRRVIMKNLGGDAPFGGAFGDDLDPDEDLFPNRQTDRIMAFDVVVPRNYAVPDLFNPANLPQYGGVGSTPLVRRVALFEGTDEYGRLQPLLGTVQDGDLSAAQNVAAARTWFEPATERPAYGTTEVWEIYNFTADAHPIHLHLVHFEILDRSEFAYDVTGSQTTPQHNGTTGRAPEISNLRDLTSVAVGPEYYERAPKDMVTALPGQSSPAQGESGQMVRIRTTFDKPGRYVWHCHILSHEDHEMMRVIQVS